MDTTEKVDPGPASPPPEVAPSTPDPSPRRRRPWVRALSWVGGVIVVLVIALVSYLGYQYVNLDQGLSRSDAVKEAHAGKPVGLTDDMNILVMGLDSRLDLKGKPLPKDVYEAMHTGNSTIGGMNTNVLMLLHLPADGRPAVAIQIPRDDFVDFPGCPHRRCDGKIKEAYDAAFQDRQEQLSQETGISEEEKHRRAREAGRVQQIKTVEAFLGSKVVVNHFVEVTMVAFYDLAKVVQPVTVCLKNDTKDQYSGADFKAGKQEITAQQAVAFVRQRRDALGDVSFSDLDRQRRQQAFIASLIHQLSEKGTFVNPARFDDLIGVAKRNIAVSEGLSPLDLLQKARQLTEGKITFYTLPIVEYFTDKYGGFANRVDVPQIQATVEQLLATGRKPTASPTKPGASPVPRPVVNVTNASGVGGTAGKLQNALATTGYGKGQLGTAPSTQQRTVVHHAPGGAPAATELATLLGSGATVQEMRELPAGTVTVVVGSSFRFPPALNVPAPAKPGAPGAPAAPAPTATPLAPVTVGTGAKDENTSTSALTALSGGRIPCVK